MDIAGKRALGLVEEAEAELAVLKKEQVLRDVLNTAEPSGEATIRLREVREVVERASAVRKAQR